MPKVMKQPYDTRLDELLNGLDEAHQVRFTTESKMYAYRYCTRYDIHLKEFEDSAYHYMLGKQINEYFRKQDCFSDVDKIDLADSYEITEYYHERFTWLLNDTIASRSANLPWLPFGCGPQKPIPIYPI